MVVAALGVIPLAGCLGLAACQGVAVDAAGDLAAAGDATLVSRCLELERRALEENQAIAILRSLVAAAPKRLAGSPGMTEAEQWALAKMREIGFDDVRA